MTPPQNPFGEDRQPLRRRLWGSLKRKSSVPKRYSVAASITGSVLGWLGVFRPIPASVATPIIAFLAVYAVDTWWRWRSKRQRALFEIPSPSGIQIASYEPSQGRRIATLVARRLQ
jgi:hypothetical protein